MGVVDCHKSGQLVILMLNTCDEMDRMAWSRCGLWTVTSPVSCVILMLNCYIVGDKMAWSRWGWLTVMSLVSFVMLNLKFGQLFDTETDLLYYYG